MEALKGISFAGLMPLDPLDAALHPFRAPQVFRHLDETLYLNKGQLQGQVADQKRPPSNGFLCLLYGMMFEHGYNSVSPDLKKSFDFYNYGVTQHLNPLCAYRLANIYSDVQQATRYSVTQDKVKAYIYLLLSQQSECEYGVKDLKSYRTVNAIQKEFDTTFKASLEMLKNFIDDIEYQCTLKTLKQMILQTVGFRLNLSSGLVQYDELIHIYNKFADTQEGSSFSYILTRRLIYLLMTSVVTQDKKTETIANIIKQSKFIAQLPNACQRAFETIFILSRQGEDNPLFEYQREYLFELTLIVKNVLNLRISEKISLASQIWVPLSQSYKILYEMHEKFQKGLHKAIVLRQHAQIIAKGLPDSSGNAFLVIPNLKEALKLQQSELLIQKSSQYLYAIPHYKLARLYKQNNMDSNNHMKKALDLFLGRVEIEQTDDYQKILCFYYVSRVKRSENDRVKEREYLEKIKQYTQNIFKNRLFSKPEILRQVKTFQYYIIWKKAMNRIQQIDSEPQVIEEQDEHFQNIPVENVVQKSAVNEEMIEQQELNASSSKQVQVTNEKIESKLRGAKNQPVIYRYKNTREVHGPYIQDVFQIELAPAITQQSGISENLRQSDLTNKVFHSRGPYASCNYITYIKGNRYFLKTICSLNRDKKQRIKEEYLSKQKTTYPIHLRKIYGFVEEEVADNVFNFGLAHEYFEFNLLEFAAQKNIGLNSRLEVAIQMFNAVKYLQTQNIFGRLKPSNVLVKQTGPENVQTNFQLLQYSVILSDWELGGPLDADLGRKGALMGYSAPEVYVKGRQPEAASDCWSLGILYFLLFFQIDLGIKEHFKGVNGKSQISFYKSYSIYNNEELQFNEHSVPIPSYLIESYRDYVELIQRMVTLDQYRRIHAPEVEKKLHKMQETMK